MIQWQHVDLEVGESLKPGQRWNGYCQFEDSWQHFGDDGWSDAWGRGFFKRPPPPTTRHTYIGCVEYAEELAYKDADELARRMTPEQYQEWLQLSYSAHKDPWWSEQREIAERKADEARVNGWVYDPQRYRRM